ncbi:collagen, type I, alpha 1b-like [Cavia porcellus]|uniref:collagen, type I, alpha 1b-like n=1 Tax=Cavia porcellus TaxID=10141 RepID=UPI002FE0258F
MAMRGWAQAEVPQEPGTPPPPDKGRGLCRRLRVRAAPPPHTNGQALLGTGRGAPGTRDPSSSRQRTGPLQAAPGPRSSSSAHRRPGAAGYGRGAPGTRDPSSSRQRTGASAGGSSSAHRRPGAAGYGPRCPRNPGPLLLQTKDGASAGGSGSAQLLLRSPKARRCWVRAEVPPEPGTLPPPDKGRGLCRRLRVRAAPPPLTEGQALLGTGRGAPGTRDPSSSRQRTGPLQAAPGPRSSSSAHRRPGAAGYGPRCPRNPGPLLLQTKDGASAGGSGSAQLLLRSPTARRCWVRAEVPPEPGTLPPPALSNIFKSFLTERGLRSLKRSQGSCFLNKNIEHLVAYGV